MDEQQDLPVEEHRFAAEHILDNLDRGCGESQGQQYRQTALLYGYGPGRLPVANVGAERQIEAGNNDEEQRKVCGQIKNDECLARKMVALLLPLLFNYAFSFLERTMVTAQDVAAMIVRRHRERERFQSVRHMVGQDLHYCVNVFSMPCKNYSQDSFT